MTNATAARFAQKHVKEFFPRHRGRLHAIYPFKIIGLACADPPRYTRPKLYLNRSHAMRATVLPLVASTLALCACASYAGDMSDNPPARAPQGECDAALVQDYIGETVSAEIGADIMARSGAASLRWGPPDSPMTMDYRPDRVNVFYDDARVIERITCG